jgi:ATP-dependent RNA helicase SUPV3L1/SUV3
VAYPEVPSIVNFKEIESDLVLERKLIIEKNEIKGEDLDYVRTVDDAKLILNFVEKIQKTISDLLTRYPSLTVNFSSEFISAKVFFSKDYVLDLLFLDDCLIPEKETFLFGQDGGVSKKVLNLHISFFNEWKERKEKLHVKTQDLLNSRFDIDIKPSNLECECSNCTSLYRTRLRENILDVSYDIINTAAANIEKEIESKSITETSYLFTDMQKETDKVLHKIRYRLKKSAINRLSNQIKGKVKEIFSYPSPLAITQEKRLRPFLNEILHSMELKEDLLTEEDYKKFFNQQNQNLWRNEKYIKREFKKIVQSYMLLKRKDISGTILQEYIGEFWTHSAVRNMKRKIIYHMGPTNSGKTYHAIQRLAEVKTGCYLAPLRLLAAELFDTLNSKGVVTNLLTGEEVVEQENATHYSSTIEMARLTEFIECCVIDEIQMITDDQRGWAWTRALVNIYAEEIHLCGDPSALSLIQQIVDLCGDELEIKEYTRMTELNVEPCPISLGEMQKSDALIVFSRRNALRYKRDLERLNFKVSIVYGRLSPEVRREQARKFDQEETDIIVATDAISMGMNLPIRRIIFTTLAKYYNSQEHEITDSEIKQIAGRAGRFQRFPTGYVNCLTKVEEGTERVQEALSVDLEQQERCMVGPDLDIYSQVNGALEENGLPILRLSEFLRLFNTMTFQDPFFCVELKEMIELAEMVEDADEDQKLSQSEVFGYTCAPVNMGLPDHVEYYKLILNSYVQGIELGNQPIDHLSGDIDYLETSIKCVELYQWLSRHFNGKNFSFDEAELLNNKTLAIERLNTLLSNKIVATCSSCGIRLADTSKHNICEGCFKSRRFARGGQPGKSKFSRRKGQGAKTTKKNAGKKKVERKRKRGFKK